MSDGEAVFSPDGEEYLGTLRYADDGSAILVSDDGEILSALDPNGDPADPADFMVEDDVSSSLDTPDADELRAELDDLRQWREGFDPVAAHEEARAAGRAASGHAAEEQWAIATGRELRNLEAELGRPLTQTETWRILEEHHGDVEHGAGGDFNDAVRRAGIMPFSPGRSFGESDNEHGEGRRAYMAQLVEDSQREERGEDPDSLPAWVEPASNDPGDVRRANLANAANGYDVDFTNNEED